MDGGGGCTILFLFPAHTDDDDGDDTDDTDAGTDDPPYCCFSPFFSTLPTLGDPSW